MEVSVKALAVVQFLKTLGNFKKRNNAGGKTHKGAVNVKREEEEEELDALSLSLSVSVSLCRP